MSILAKRRRAAPILAALALLLLGGGFLAAQDVGALRDLTAGERERIERGEAVIRSVPDYRKLALGASGAAADELRAAVAALRPNYLTEVINVFPAANEAAASALIARLAAALADPTGYVGIPYWSKRQQKTYDLFDKMEVRSRVAIAGGESIEALQHMEPFDDFRVRLEYRLEGPGGTPPSPGRASALRFSVANLEPIIYSYRNFQAVSTGNMIWHLYVFRDGDRIVFYGVGAVRAFDLFGVVRDRLEPSFMGRVESFFKYMSGKMRG